MPDDYTPREMRLMAERDAALSRAERAESSLAAIWLVLVKNKELLGEPDTWFALHTGTEKEALALGIEMEIALANVGHGRCVSRVRAIEPGRQYRVSAVMIPGPLRPL